MRVPRRWDACFASRESRVDAGNCCAGRARRRRRRNDQRQGGLVPRLKASTFLLLALLLCGRQALARTEVLLNGERWSVSINPERLAVTARPADSAPIVISSAR